MSRIKDLAIQTSRIKDNDFILIDRNTTPIRVTGEIFKSHVSGIAYSPVYYLLPDGDDSVMAVTNGDLYILGESIFTASGVTALPIKTNDGETSSEKLWMELVTGTPNKIILYSSTGAVEYEEGDDTVMDSPLALESLYGLIPDTEGIPHIYKYPLEGLSPFDVEE